MIKKLLLTLLVLLFIFVPVCADSVNTSVAIEEEDNNGGGGGSGSYYPPAQNQTVFIPYPLLISYVPRPQQPQQETQEQIPQGQEVETAEDSGGLVTGALTESPLKGDVKYAVLALVLIVVFFFVARSLEESRAGKKYAYKRVSRGFKKLRFR